MGAVRAGSRLGGEGGGGRIPGAEHQSGRGEVDSAAGHDAEDFSTVQGEVARGHRHAKPRDAGEASSAGHVVKAGAGIEVMAAAGASSDGGTMTVAAVGEDVATGANDQVQIH